MLKEAAVAYFQAGGTKEKKKKGKTYNDGQTNLNKTVHDHLNAVLSI